MYKPLLLIRKKAKILSS